MGLTGNSFSTSATSLHAAAFASLASMAITFQSSSPSSIMARMPRALICEFAYIFLASRLVVPILWLRNYTVPD
eukprot:1191551-Prorocentrum_minimum.AAC.1